MTVTSKSIVPTGEPFLLKRPFRLASGDWGFVLNLKTGKFEVYRASRPELAHLTIMWGTQSGELDVHLTYRHEGAMADGDPKNYVPLFTVPKHRLEEAGIRFNTKVEEIMVPHLLRSYRKFRPGWLAHRGYFVRVIDQETMLAWLRSLAPKKKRKYRFELGRLTDHTTYPTEMVEDIFDPRILHYLEEERVAPVSATRVRHGRVIKEHGILLNFTVGHNGKMGWWGMRQRDVQAMGRDMSSYVFDSLVPLVKPEHAEIWEKIITGLGMDDFEETRSIAHTVRQFLANPRNPVGRPYPDPPPRIITTGAQVLDE